MEFQFLDAFERGRLRARVAGQEYPVQVKNEQQESAYRAWLIARVKGREV